MNRMPWHTKPAPRNGAAGRRVTRRKQTRLCPGQLKRDPEVRRSRHQSDTRVRTRTKDATPRRARAVRRAAIVGPKAEAFAAAVAVDAVDDVFVAPEELLDEDLLVGDAEAVRRADERRDRGPHVADRRAECHAVGARGLRGLDDERDGRRVVVGVAETPVAREPRLGVVAEGRRLELPHRADAGGSDLLAHVPLIPPGLRAFGPVRHDGRSPPPLHDRIREKIREFHASLGARDDRRKPEALRFALPPNLSLERLRVLAERLGPVDGVLRGPPEVPLEVVRDLARVRQSQLERDQSGRPAAGPSSRVTVGTLSRVICSPRVLQGECVL